MGLLPPPLGCGSDLIGEGVDAAPGMAGSLPGCLGHHWSTVAELAVITLWAQASGGWWVNV